MKKYITALTIAGFDGSGGAGIQADLKTFSALGCYGMSIITALPVQNTQGVRNIYDISVDCIQEQCDAIFEDICVDVVKIGMLHRCEIIEVIVDALKKYNPSQVVVDPVMVAKSGDRLLDEQAVDALKEYIFPLATVITPNIPEVQDIIKEKIICTNDIKRAGKYLLSMGPKNVVIKGGHQEGPCSCDYLFTKNEAHIFSAPRINTKNTHGTGCTFSAAIAAYLGHNYSIEDSVKLAKNYLTEALLSGAKYKLGHGYGPVNHACFVDL